VFDSASNIKTENEKILLTLVTKSAPDLAQGIRINSPERFTFNGLMRGKKVRRRGGLIYFEDFPWIIDLRDAQRWECNLLTEKGDWSEPSIVAAWECAWRELVRRKNLSEIGELVFSNSENKLSIQFDIWNSMKEIAIATKNFDLRITPAMTSLIGFGTGLTPTFDDWLVGYLAGLRCMAEGTSEREHFISELGKGVIQQSYKTNDISRTYLILATKGQVSSILCALAKAILIGADRDEIIRIMESAIKVGHNSGFFSVLGLLMGQAIWDGNLHIKFSEFKTLN
jgi:hypothetical protein